MESNSSKWWLPLQFGFDLRRRSSLEWRDVLAKDVLTSWLAKDSSGKGIALPLTFASPSPILCQDTGSYLIFLKALALHVEWMIWLQLHETWCHVEIWNPVSREVHSHSNPLHHHHILHNGGKNRQLSNQNISDIHFFGRLNLKWAHIFVVLIAFIA